jgi:tetratricopeptide (TPR) repeat protein
MKTLIKLSVFLIPFLGLAQNMSLFDQGKEQYRAEKYEEALQQWMKILENGEHSANLYYNIGNAHYQLHHIGPSIYYYEKAMMLDPNDADIQNNLAFAKNATVDAIEPLPQTFFVKWDHQISSLMSYDSWSWMAVLGILLFTILFLRYYFSMESRSKRIFFVTSVFSLFIGVLALSMAFRTYHISEVDKEAIVFSESAEVKNGPRMSDQTIFQLHEGTKVKILNLEDDWCRIVLADGKDGWIPLADIKEL